MAADEVPQAASPAQPELTIRADIIGLADAPSAAPSAACRPSGELLQVRRTHYGPNTSLSYASPLHMVRGKGQYLFDASGQRYLDCVNNVAHVGHAHPGIASAIAQQLSTLNTNSRYLSQELVDYTEALLATLPAELSSLYCVCSGQGAHKLHVHCLSIATRGMHSGSHTDLFWNRA